MALNRIQKLLFSEYCDFEDMVLVESPFAQTTREGLGLRQVQLGLTPTKLVLAVDVLPPANESKVLWTENLDPEIETLELIAVYPVECVNLSVYRRKRRQSLKAHFCNNRILYFELGGFEKRKMFWNLWCERVRFFCPEDGGSSVSETSVATTTSASTLKVISTNKNLDENGKPQMWCKFGNDKGDHQHNSQWVERYLYMDESKENYDKNLVEQEMLGQHIPLKQGAASLEPVEDNFIQINTMLTSVPEAGDVNFYQPAEDFIYRTEQMSETSTESTDVFTLYPVVSSHLSQMSETAVKNWEAAQKIIDHKERHPRRYGLVPQSHFLYGLGPWNIHTGDRVSTQLKRSASVVRIRRQPDDPELSLPISKRLLTVSISCEAFHLDRGLNIDTCISKLAVPDNNALLFWTPEYWYRPQPARDSYKEFLDYMKTLTKNKIKLTSKENRIRNKFKKKKIHYAGDMGANCDSERVAPKNGWAEEKSFETYLQRLRAALKIEVALTAWDFDSTTLAYQLTMIDKELFLKIKPYELQVIMWQRSSKHAPNVNSFIAFSHRISCLVATEILRDDSEKLRARLIVRYINAADKCDRIASFQSCKSLLSGLQSLPVYRLHKTWAYLRQHHAMKYQLFENLCRRYSDPRSQTYQKSFYLATISPPYLPYIGDILARLVGKVTQLPTDFIAQIIIDKDKILDKNDKQCSTKSGLNLEKGVSKTFLRQRQPVLLPVSKKIALFFTKLWKIDVSKPVESKTVKSTFHAKPQIGIQTELAIKIIRDETKIKQDDRKERLEKVIEFLELCQTAAVRYALSTNDLAKEYLLKARYREDRENFYNSFKMEQKIELLSNFQT